MQNFIRSEPMIVTSDFPLPTRTILQFGSSATGPQLPIFWCRIKMELLLTLVLDSTPLLVEFWYVLSSIFKSWCNINKKTKVNFLISNPPNRHIKHCLEAAFFSPTFQSTRTSILTSGPRWGGSPSEWRAPASPSTEWNTTCHRTRDTIKSMVASTDLIPLVVFSLFQIVALVCPTWTDIKFLKVDDFYLCQRLPM